LRSPTVHHVLDVCEVVVYRDWVAWSHRDGFSDVVWSAVVARVRHRGSTCSASRFGIGVPGWEAQRAPGTLL
jgi:hypothetical protein